MDDRQRFEWDASNTRHLARHDVAPLEAEETILDPDAIILEIQDEDEDRFKAVGATLGGRFLVVVFTFRGDAIRPITAYAAPRQLEKLYLEQKSI